MVNLPGSIEDGEAEARRVTVARVVELRQRRVIVDVIQGRARARVESTEQHVSLVRRLPERVRKLQKCCVQNVLQEEDLKKYLAAHIVRGGMSGELRFIIKFVKSHILLNVFGEV